MMKLHAILLGLCGLALAPSFAAASFDLALISDSGTDSIHRFDPITGTYLGNFGSGILVDPKGVAVNQAQNKAFVLDSASRVTVWNYNTGEFIDSFNVGGTAGYMNMNGDGTLNITLTDRVRRINQSGALVQNYIRSGALTIQQGFLANDGRFYMSTESGGNYSLEQFTSSGTFVNNSSWAGTRMMNIGTATIGTFLYNTFNAYDSFGNLYCEYDYLNFGPNNISYATNSTLASPAGIALGHAGMTYVVGKVRATPTQGAVMRFDRTTGTFGTIFGQNTIQTPTGIATVIAPEPVSMASLGLGLIALLARRRKS